MKEMTRRKLEMAKRVLQFSREHPDTNPGYLALVARLETLVARAEQLERQEKIEQEELRRIQTELD